MSFKNDFFKGEPLSKIGDCEFWGKQIITPEIAQEILNTNVKNRKLNKARVSVYARIMQKGRWGYIADGFLLSFDKNGNLTNGQHRLNAIIECGCTMEMYIARNSDTEAGALKLPFDTNQTRSTSNITGNKARYESPIKYLIRTFAEKHPSLVTSDEVVAFISSLDDDGRYVLDRIGCIGYDGFSASIRAAFFFWFIINGNKELTLDLVTKVTHRGALNEKEGDIQRYITKPRAVSRGENANRLEEFLHTYALISEKRDTKAFREEIVKQVKGWIVGRY